MLGLGTTSSMVISHGFAMSSLQTRMHSIKLSPYSFTMKNTSGLLQTCYGKEREM